MLHHCRVTSQIRPSLFLLVMLIMLHLFLLSTSDFWCSSIVPRCLCRIQDTKTPKGYAFADFADPASVQALVLVPRHLCTECSSTLGSSRKVEPCGVQRSGTLFFVAFFFQISFCKLTFSRIHVARCYETWHPYYFMLLQKVEVMWMYWT